MTRIMLTVFVLILLPVTAAAASGGEIRGTVLDGHSGEPLSNVAIQIVGIGYRTISDATGHFRITEILAGDHVLKVSTVGYWPLNLDFHLDPGETKEFELVLTAETRRRVDTVSVPAGPDLIQDAPTVLSLSGNDVKNLSSVLVDDPLRPFRLFLASAQMTISKRDSHCAAPISRVSECTLMEFCSMDTFHTIETTSASGSITAINTDLIRELDLYEGAYPVRFGDRSAAALDIHMRDGSSDRYSFRVSASFATASAMAEGPLGKFKRCSWIAGFRKSYLQYLLAHTNDPSLAFGIADGEGRLSCTITPKNNIILDVIDSYTDLNRSSVAQRLGINSLELANYHFTFADLAWRYTPTDKLLVSNQAAWMGEKFNDSNPNRNPLGAGDYSEWVAASTLTWIWNSHNPLNAGINVRAMRDTGYEDEYFVPDIPRVLDVYGGTGTIASAFVQQSLSLWSQRLQLTAGGRWDHESIDGVAAFSPQTSVTLSPWRPTRFQLGWGQYVQYPEISQLTSNLGSPNLLPMRSTQVIGAVEQRIGERARIRAEFYDRQDRDLLYQPFYDPRLIDGQVFNPPLNPMWENSVRGYSRGAQITLQRVSANRLNGWVSFAYGRTRLYDGATGLWFPSDWDQRQMVNAYASYRIRPTVNLSLRWTYGSGFPIPGFLQKVGPLYFLSSQLNQLRLGTYQRLDFRVNKSWTGVHWRTTLFGEVLNLTGKTNYRFDSFNGYNPKTGQAFITLDKLFPILPSVGLQFEWQRDR